MRFCALRSGSKGNMTMVEAGKTRLLVDVGISCRAAAGALADIGVEAGTVSAILVTHDHSDHVSGVGTFARRYNVPVYANAGTWRAMTTLTGEIPEHLRCVFETGCRFNMNGIEIMPFATPHDAAEPVGYSFVRDKTKITVMTDIGCFTESLCAAASGSDIILIESNHDVGMLTTGIYPYPLKRRILGDRGHLSNDDCGYALTKLYMNGVKTAILGHLSRENNTEEIALLSVRSVLAKADISDFELYVAHRDAPTQVFEIV